MAVNYVAVAKKNLHPSLMRFFTRYPPPASVLDAALASPSTKLTTSAGLPPSASSSHESESVAPQHPAPTDYPENPFLPTKNQLTGNWRGPVYSLRRQADLVKFARSCGIEALLPTGPKSTEYKLQRRIEAGLQVKGTGVGQKVKGRLWERTMKTRLDKRKRAMLGMPKLIETWRQGGRGNHGIKFPR